MDAALQMLLQCGHGPSAVETGRAVRRHHPVVHPSMRPRPVSRGDSTYSIITGAPPASFNAATARQPWRRRGHGSATPLHRPPSMRPRPVSRGDSVTRRTQPTPHGSFNAATARQPWRPGRHSSPASASSTFNAATARQPWRRGVDAFRVGNGSAPSMRPRPVSRGDARSPAESCPAPHPFNAATARQPWRPARAAERAAS